MSTLGIKYDENIPKYVEERQQEGINIIQWNWNTNEPQTPFFDNIKKQVTLRQTEGHSKGISLDPLCI